MRGANLDECSRWLFEAAAGPALALFEDGSIEVNPEGHRVLGYAEAELNGKALSELLDPGSSSFREALHSLPPAASAHERWALLRKDGSRLELEVALKKLATGPLLAIARHSDPDQANARELFNRLHKIASQVPGVVYQFKQRPDGSSCFPYASERIRDIYRVTPEEVVDDASKAFAALHPDDYDAVVESIQQSAATMTPWQFEYRVAFPDGDVRWLYGNSMPDHQADGSVLWHGFITDVTANKQAEEARARLEAQLLRSQKLESVGLLAGGVAHDFNNLLTSVIAFIELAQFDLAKDAPAAEYLERAVEAAERGSALSQQLLAFARKKVVRPEAADLNAIVQGMSPMIRRVLGEQIEVKLELCEDLGAVKVDIGSVEQVIMNLVVNARDAMPNGGALRLQTHNLAAPVSPFEAHSEIPAGELVVLEVADSGEGMSEEVRRRIFEPFFTTKPQGSGTGLGLAMCHGIVKQAGGTIAVRSAPGQGACFSVYLPRLAGAHTPPRADTGKRKAAGGSETVLIAEDEPMILRAASTALERLGYRVLRTTNGVEALDLVRAFPDMIHLLITDIVMPRMSGYDLAAQITSLRPGIKVLYASGYASGQADGALADHGVLREGLHFLQKPYTLSALGVRVREVLDS